MLSALLVATLVTLLRMSGDDEVTLAGGDHAQAAADQLSNLFEQSDTARKGLVTLARVTTNADA
jgi:hypothetical protein